MSLTDISLNVHRHPDLPVTLYNFIGHRSDMPGKTIGWQWSVTDDEFMYADFLQAWGWRELFWLLDLAQRKMLGDDTPIVLPLD